MENLNNSLETHGEENKTGQEVIAPQGIQETPLQSFSAQDRQNNILAGIKSDRLKALAQQAYSRINVSQGKTEEIPEEKTEEKLPKKEVEDKQPEMLEGRSNFIPKLSTAL